MSTTPPRPFQPLSPDPPARIPAVVVVIALATAGVTLIAALGVLVRSFYRTQDPPSKQLPTKVQEPYSRAATSGAGSGLADRPTTYPVAVARPGRR